MVCNKLETFTFFIIMAFMLTFKLDTIHCSKACKNDTLCNHIHPVNLLNSLAEQNQVHYNILLNPHAIRGLLLASAAFAYRETKYELERLLFDTTYKELGKEINSLKNVDGWSVAAFVNRRFDVTPCIHNLISEFKYIVDYNDNNATAYAINNWTFNRTHQDIWTIVYAKFFHSDTFLTAVHADSTNFKWLKPFRNILSKNDTSIGIEFLGQMLHQDNVFLYGNLTDLNAIAVSIPLSENANMIVLQPHEVKYFLRLKDELSKIDIRSIPDRLKETEISLYFPILDKVKMERDMIKTIDKAYGIKRPFMRQADFRKLHVCGENTHIAFFNQRTRISTDLKQVRVSSATSLTFAIPSDNNGLISDDEEIEEEAEEETSHATEIVVPPKKNLPKVILAHPFIYGIVQDGRLIWIGSLHKPHNNRAPVYFDSREYGVNTS